jgi:hypothetical protein
VNEVRRQLREEVLSALENRISDPVLYPRVIAVAQFEMSELSGYGEISFYPYLLEEFRGVLHELQTYKNLLRQAYGRWARETLDEHDTVVDRRLSGWAHELYNLTGGHPKAIEETLNYIGKRTEFARNAVFAEERLAICKGVLTQLIERQVRAWLPAVEYQLAFSQLWMFRYLSPSVFRKFLLQVRDNPNWRDLNAVVHSDDYELERGFLWGRLTETPLLQSKGLTPGRFFSHQLAPIWRKLGNLILQVTKPELYSALHRDVYNLLYDIAFDPAYVEPYARIDCFVEALYHLTQSVQQSRDAFTEQAKGQLDELFKILEAGQFFEEGLYTLRNLLEGDQELATELNRAGVQHTQRQLIDIVQRRMP